MRQKRIYINKPTPNRKIVPAPEVIQPRLLIVHVGAIAERLNGAKGGSKGAGGGKDLAPCIVYIFYHFITTGVNKANDIALQIMDIAVLRAVKLHNGRAILASY